LRLTEEEKRAERARGRAASALAKAVRGGEIELVGKAFEALGGGPTSRELDLVAAAFEGEADAFWLAANDRAAFDALAEVAAKNGSSGFVAFDLVTVITTGESRVGM
jgi:hypothetical protein